jgi:hypothetical protein
MKEVLDQSKTHLIKNQDWSKKRELYFLIKFPLLFEGGVAALVN